MKAKTIPTIELGWDPVPGCIGCIFQAAEKISQQFQPPEVSQRPLYSCKNLSDCRNLDFIKMFTGI